MKECKTIIGLNFKSCCLHPSLHVCIYSTCRLLGNCTCCCKWEFILTKSTTEVDYQTVIVNTKNTELCHTKVSCISFRKVHKWKWNVECDLKKTIMDRKETIDADLRSVLLSSCWWAIQVGFGIWEPDPGLLLPGRVPCETCPLHTSIFHHHPSLFPSLLCWAPNGTLILDGEVSALFHPQDSWKVPHPLLVSLKNALVAIGWCMVQQKKKRGFSTSRESDVS